MIETESSVLETLRLTMLDKHKTSILMLIVAISFYVIFGLIIPELYYSSPEPASRGLEHATAGLGQVLKKVVPVMALIMGLYAAARFFNELK